MSMPLLVKLRIWNLCMCNSLPDRKRTALSPALRPSNSRPLSVTTSPAPAWTTMPLVPDTSTLPSVCSQLIVIALLIVTAPKPPGSRQLISPPAVVWAMAPAKVRQGEERLHVLPSLPRPETQVREVWALAGMDNSARHVTMRRLGIAELFILLSVRRERLFVFPRCVIFYRRETSFTARFRYIPGPH